MIPFFSSPGKTVSYVGANDKLCSMLFSERSLQFNCEIRI